MRSKECSKLKYDRSLKYVEVEVMLSDEGLEKYQAYVLYGMNREDLVKRIVNYLEGCDKVIADKALEPILNSICGTTKPRVVEISSYGDVDKMIRENENGMGIVFEVRSPVEGIIAIAMVLVNEYNKRVARS